MLDFLNTLSQSLAPLLEMSVTAAYAAAVVIVLRLLLKKRAPKQVLCLLWLVVFARLLIPVSIESPLSIVPDALPGQEQVQFSSRVPADPEAGGQGDPVLPAQPGTSAHGQAQSPAVNGPAVNGTPVIAAPEGAVSNPVQPKSPAPFPWRALLAGIWLAGAAAMGGYALISYLRLRRRLFDAIRAQDGAWEHPAVESPFILGVLRPRIYLPAGLVGRPRQFILCHERAHLRRLDHIVKPVCWAALALHWFNPLVWAAFLLMSRDIEAACDEAVVRKLGSGVKADYSTTLLALATSRRVPAPCPLSFDEGDAKGRIQNVLRYRRPTLWVIVVSIVMAVMAAVCLLTDPVAAKEPEDGPGPDATASQVPANNLADTLLDPWMREVLDGTRDFTTTNPYNHNQTYGINDLRAFFYGDDQNLDTVVEMGPLAVIDLDRDGVNELVATPVGDDEYLYSAVGYLILHRQGDVVYGYAPGYRSSYQFKEDGTFYVSSGAADWGIASLSFQGEKLVYNHITWCSSDSDDGKELYFVNGLKAAPEEFDAAVAAQDAKADPVWYTYAGGVLSAQLPNSLEQPDQNASVPDAPLDAPLVGQLVPDDPNEWYKVAELPGSGIWMFSRNYGSETLLRWGRGIQPGPDGTSYKVFDHTAHTPRGIMPNLKKLDNFDGIYGPLAVISNVGNGAGVSLYELVVYDLDAASPTDYTHDWTALRDDFNNSVSFRYDKTTHVLTYSYHGQTVEAAIDADADAYRRIEEEGVSLRVTGNNVNYWFDRVNEGDITIELTIELFVGDDIVPLIVPGYVTWTIKFNGRGFDTVPESCQLGYPGSTYQ